LIHLEVTAAGFSLRDFEFRNRNRHFRMGSQEE